MPHVYTTDNTADACNLYRNGEQFVNVLLRLRSTATFNEAAAFTNAIPALIESLQECESRLSLLVESERGGKLLDAVAMDKARAALESIGAL